VLYRPGSPEDALIVDGPNGSGYPQRPSTRRGASGNIANVYATWSNETMYENALNEHTRYFRKVGVTFIHHPTKDRTRSSWRPCRPESSPAGPGRSRPDDDQPEAPIPRSSRTPRTSCFLVARRRVRRGGKPSLPMTLTAKIMYDWVKFYAEALETLSRRCSRVVRPDEVRGPDPRGDVEFSEPTRCSRECPTPTD